MLTLLVPSYLTVAVLTKLLYIIMVLGIISRVHYPISQYPFVKSSVVVLIVDVVLKVLAVLGRTLLDHLSQAPVLVSLPYHVGSTNLDILLFHAPVFIWHCKVSVSQLSHGVGLAGSSSRDSV